MRVLGVHSDGGMRERFCLPADRLHKSARLDFDQLCIVEPLSISDHAVNRRAKVQPGERVLVVGVGPIGFAAVQFALAAGAAVSVLERSPSRCAYVRDQLGVPTHAALDDIEALPEDARFDVVLDATGNKHAMEASFGAVVFHSREMTVMSSRNSFGRFPEIIALIEAGKIDTAPWITHRMALADVPAEFPDLEGTEGLMKCVVEIGS